MSEVVKRPLFAAAGCALAIAVLLLFAYAVGPAAHLDARILVHFAARDAPRYDSIAQTFAHSADFLPLALMLVALCGFALLRRQPERAVAAVFVVAGANLMTQLLKVALSHPRLPPFAFHEIGPAAFPSGHATASMSIAVAAVLVAPRSVRPVVAIFAAGFALAVSGSVLVLAWHFPSDVMAGWLMAWGFGFVALAGIRAAARNPRGAAAAHPPTTTTPTLPALTRE
jgi:membrane-associated phospholipid phosphatase